MDSKNPNMDIIQTWNVCKRFQNTLLFAVKCLRKMWWKLINPWVVIKAVNEKCNKKKVKVCYVRLWLCIDLTLTTWLYEKNWMLLGRSKSFTNGNSFWNYYIYCKNLYERSLKCWYFKLMKFPYIYLGL